MIYITGDTHRKLDIKKLDPEHFPQQEQLTREDYLIICGDFGGVWTGNEKDDAVLDMYEQKRFTTLFITGNHENFPAIFRYPEEQWHGGRIHRLREHVIHLMNGQVFQLEGKTFFTMGGATSVDRFMRDENVDWWPQEEPSAAEYREAVANLEAYDWAVDYVLTHTVPEKVKNTFPTPENFVRYESQVEKFLDSVLDDVDYCRWYCGHIHIDRDFPRFGIRVLYRDVIPLE